MLDVLFLRPDFSPFGYNNQADDVRAFVVMGAMEQLQPPPVAGGLTMMDSINPCIRSVHDIALMAFQLVQVRMDPVCSICMLTYSLGIGFHASTWYRTSGELFIY